MGSISNFLPSNRLKNNKSTLRSQYSSGLFPWQTTFVNWWKIGKLRTEVARIMCRPPLHKGDASTTSGLGGHGKRLTQPPEYPVSFLYIAIWFSIATNVVCHFNFCMEITSKAKANFSWRHSVVFELIINTIYSINVYVTSRNITNIFITAIPVDAFSLVNIFVLFLKLNITIPLILICIKTNQGNTFLKVGVSFSFLWLTIDVYHLIEYQEIFFQNSFFNRLQTIYRTQKSCNFIAIFKYVSSKKGKVATLLP